MATQIDQSAEGSGGEASDEFLKVASWVTGITYAVLFGGSLAFQVLVNYQNKSTKGFSTDYALVGFIGFFLLVFNQTIGRIDPTTDAGRVHAMDLIFAKSAFMFSSMAYTQTWIYPSHQTLQSTRTVVTSVMLFFLLSATLESQLGIPLKSYLHISLIDLAAVLKAGSSLIKYLFQIRENWVNKSTDGVSKAAFWSDFWGTVFCFAQLQIDSVIAGYSSFLADPQLNKAKMMIAFFGLVNTSIILMQIHCIYTDLPRQRFVHLDSTFGSIQGEELEDFVDEKVVFQDWKELFDTKANEQPMLSRVKEDEKGKSQSLSRGSSTTLSAQEGSYYSP